MALAASSTNGSTAAISRCLAVERNRQNPVGLEEGKLQPVRKDRLVRRIVWAEQGQIAISRIGDAQIAFGDQPELYEDEIETFGRGFSGPSGP